MIEREHRTIETRDKNYVQGEGAGWRCSSCGMLIASIEDGWVEWLAAEDDYGETKLMGLRLVHRATTRPGAPEGYGCRYDDRQEFRNRRAIVEGLPLASIVGPDGLMQLLALLAEEEFPKDEVLELTKRVQIPKYEQARNLFQEATEAGVLTPAVKHGYYLQSELETLLRWARAMARSPKTVS